LAAGSPSAATGARLPWTHAVQLVAGEVPMFDDIAWRDLRFGIVAVGVVPSTAAPDCRDDGDDADHHHGSTLHCAAGAAESGARSVADTLPGADADTAAGESVGDADKEVVVGGGGTGAGQVRVAAGDLVVVVQGASAGTTALAGQPVGHGHGRRWAVGHRLRACFAPL
jgi:hypothetical protein